MKSLLILAFVFLSPSVLARSNCVGPVTIRHGWFGFPMLMDARVLVSFSPDLNVCRHLLQAGPVEAKVTIEILGGSPTEYEGPLYLDRSRTHVLNDPSGERMEFRIQDHSDGSIEIEVHWIPVDADEPFQSILRARLNCV